MRREREALGLTERATVHDLRRTAATHLGDLGIDRLVIGKLLNHAEQGVTGRVYDLGAYAEPKRLAMAAWSNKIMEIVAGQAAPSNVTPITGAAG
jgi:integrase